MKNKLIEVSFDSLLEIDYLNLLETQVKENPDSILSDALVYDEHHVLLVAAFLAKDFLRVIHFPETMTHEKDEHIYLHLEFWSDLINENIVIPSTPGYLGTPNAKREPTDMYLGELFREVRFEGYIDPKDYPFLTHINGNPYIPSWYVLKWAKKALKMLEDRMANEKKADDSHVQ